MDHWEDVFRLAAQSDPEPIRRFTASYDSEGACGHPILEGERAGYIGDDDEPTCGDCIEQY